jgi:photosystem II stability/assembly factor-like uncharacterized protein
MHLPPVTVDPTNHRVLYVEGREGLYKTDDDAASWRLVFSPGEFRGVEAIAVSPAAPEVMYVAVTGAGGRGDFVRFLRSRDAGATWDDLGVSAGSMCGAVVYLLSPHSTDAQRVFRTAGCYAGRDSGGALEQSTDQGATWSILLNLGVVPPGTLAADALTGYPVRLAGGEGRAPSRFYLAMKRDPRLGGASLLRTDDDGSSWAEVLAFRGGGLFVSRDPYAPIVQIGGLAYEPGTPDRVYVGLASRCADTRSTGCEQESHVLTSADGGLTWTDWGLYGHGKINDLALGIDGLNLYAATEQGVWRLRLG